MGEVYKARDTRLDRIVAIKVSKRQSSTRLTDDHEVVARAPMTVVVNWAAGLK